MPARDVFICHASTDKAKFVRPLARSLASRAVSSWVDEAMIEPGDSIIDAVNDGLRLSRFVLVVVTPELMAGRWPRRELNAALSKELRTGATIVIPVLAIPHELWVEEFPLLADKLYLNWDEGVDAVAARVAHLFARRPATDWAYEHPEDWVGPVWARCTPDVGGRHLLTFRWGPYLREVAYMPKQGQSWSMVHHKIHKDQVTLHIHVEPPAVITIGQGPSPDAAPNATNIDEGWIRSAGTDVEEAASPSGVPSPTERHALAELLGDDEST